MKQLVATHEPVQYLTPTLRGSGGSIVLWSVFSYHGLNLGNSHWKLVQSLSERVPLQSNSFLIFTRVYPGPWSALEPPPSRTCHNHLSWDPSMRTTRSSFSNDWIPPPISNHPLEKARICDLITTGKGRNQWIISFAYLSLPQQTLRYLKISTRPWPGVGIPSFPPENHGLRREGANSYSHSFTHACEYGLKLWS